MSEKVVKVYLTYPLLKILQSLTNKTGLGKSEIMRTAFLEYVENHNLMNK